MGGQASAPWYLGDILEEVQEPSKKLEASFHHINRSVNVDVDRLAKVGIQLSDLVILF